MRAAAPIPSPPRLTHKLQPFSIVQPTHLESLPRARLQRAGAQSVHGNTDSADSNAPADAQKPGPPDPWATPSDPRLSEIDLVVNVASATVESPLTDSSPLGFRAPPSPWDAANGPAGISSSVPPHSAGAKAATASTASSTPTPASDSSDNNPGGTSSNSSNTGGTAGPDNGSSTNGAATGSGAANAATGTAGGGGGGRRGVRESVSGAGSAQLSKDTAALLSRLRAELARTSNIPMPPPRPNTASGTATSSSTGAGTGSSNTGGGSRRGKRAGPEPIPAAAASTTAAAAPATPASGSSGSSGAPKPGPGPAGAEMSKEALAAALAASGVAAGGSGTGSDAAAAASSPTSPPGLGSFFSGLFRSRQQRTAPAAPPAGPNDGPGGDATSTSTSGSGSGSVSQQPTVAAADRLASTVSSSSSSGGGGNGRPMGRKRRAVVVGGGIGGLVSAARLAKEGFSVTLLEANSQVGGRCQSVQRGRFRFDTGPSLLLFIETYRRAFAELGTSLAQQVPVVRVTPAAYRVFFQGAGSLDMLYDVQRMVEQLEGVEKGAGQRYLQWLSSSRAALQLGLEGFIERDVEGLGDIVGRALQDEELRSLLASVGVGELLGTHHDRMARRFRDPRLRAMFTFQDLYVGLSPYTAPGVYSLLAATELTDGVWYPLGGFGQIRDALMRVGQGLGVRLRCGARVAAIRTSPGPGGSQVVEGVTLASGEELPADVVVSNRDVPLTYELLRGPAETHGSAQSRRLLSADFSAGVISFNWSLNKRVDALLHHNVFLSGDFEGSWVRATGPDSLARGPNFYVHCPGRTDPTACPPGSDSVMVLLPVANMQEIVKAREAERRRGSPLASLPGPLGEGLAAAAAAGSSSSSSSPSFSPSSSSSPVDYSALVAAGREAVFRTMAEAGITDVRQHVVDEMVIDPVEWRDRYSLAHGAAFGLSHGLSQLSVFRPGLADKQVRGLYLVGASTRPGNGVPLTMISADLVTQRVMQDVAAGII